MYLITRTQPASANVYCSRNRSPEQAHTLGTDLHGMTENPDGLLLYMSLMWQKSTMLDWDNQRFNDALDWLQEKGYLNETAAVHYKRK